MSLLELAGAVAIAVPASARVTVGDAHACALARDARVYCWETPANPSRVRALEGATAISAGGDRTCAIVDGSIRCVGPRGQVLDGSTRLHLGASAVSAGHSHACVLRRSGDVACWGDDSFGAVASLSDSVRVSAGRFGTCSVQRSGALVCWGAASLIPWAPGGLGFLPPEPAPPTVLRGVGDAIDVSLRGAFPCLVRATGRVLCWTPEDAPTLLPVNPLPPGSEVEGVDDALLVSGSLVLRATGALVAVEIDLDRSPTAFVARPVGEPVLASVVDADGSLARGCAVERRGRVVCW